MFVDALPETRLHRQGADREPAGRQDIFYRVRFQDLADRDVGRAAVGRFRTAPADRRSVSFVWSGDTAGQGWGIDEARGGMRTYATMLKNRPDFFIHSGDNIYADGPIPAEMKLPDGELWSNLVTEEKSKPAETLDEYRGNYKYNLLDENLRAFNAEVPMFAQWDDHEVDQQLVAGRAAAASAGCGEDERARCSRRAPAAPFTNSCRCAQTHGRARPRLSQDLLRPAARRVHARYAQLPRPERRRRRRSYGPTLFPRRRAGRLAQA